MDPTLELASSDEQSKSDSSAQSKPKRRSLIERQLETNLTVNVVTPLQAEGGNTSRYGRTRRLKTDSELLNIDNSFSKTYCPEIHGESSGISKKSSLPNNLENQIQSIYDTNVSLSRFGPEKVHEMSSSKLKIYSRQDLLQNNYKELSNLSNSHTKHGTHLNNIFERTVDESCMDIYDQGSSSASKMNGEVVIKTQSSRKSKEIKPDNINNTNASVVKILDFDNKKKTDLQSKKPTRKSLESGIVTPESGIGKLVRKSTDSKSNTIKKSVESDDKNKSKEENKDKISKSDIFEMEALSEYQVGDLAWARIGTFPFWPCIVTRESVSNMFVKKKLFGRTVRYIIHVTFLGDNGSRSWVSENLLRKFSGKKEFMDVRDQVASENKKKDPKLYAAFFISDKKQIAWNKAVEEGELLLREPKRLRAEAFNNMLIQSAEQRNSSKSDTCSKTDNDVSLSESLLDTLFSVDESQQKIKVNKNEIKKIKKRSLDVSEVVTACLDDMVVKTGISMIQKQSHMDRWLQKAKSITPEKYVKTKVNTTKSNKKNKYIGERGLSSSKKSRSTRNNTNGNLSDHCAIDVSEDSLILDDTVFIIENGKDTQPFDDSYKSVNNHSKGDSGLGYITSFETLTNGVENKTPNKESIGIQNFHFSDQSEQSDELDRSTTQHQTYLERPVESLQKNVIQDVETISPSIFDVDEANQKFISSENVTVNKNLLPLQQQTEASKSSVSCVSTNLMCINNNNAIESKLAVNPLLSNKFNRDLPSLLTSRVDSVSIESNCVNVEMNTNQPAHNVPEGINILENGKQKVGSEIILENSKTPNGKELVLEEKFKKSYVKLIPIEKLKDHNIRRSMDDSLMNTKKTKNGNFRAYDSFSNAYVSIVPLESLMAVQENEMFLNQCVSLGAKTTKKSSKRNKLKLVRKPETNLFFDSFKAKGERHPDFLKYLELHQDRISEEQPELNSKEIISYLYGTWLYENNSKANNKGYSNSDLESHATENDVEVAIFEPTLDKLNETVNCTNSMKAIETPSDCLNIENVVVNDEVIVSMKAIETSSDCQNIENVVVNDEVIVSNEAVEAGSANDVSENCMRENVNSWEIKDTCNNNVSNIVEVNIVAPSVSNVSSSCISNTEASNVQVTEKNINVSEEALDVNTKLQENNNVSRQNNIISNAENEIVTLGENNKTLNVLPGKDDPEFKKYLEANENRIMDERPEFCYLDIIEYLYQLWLKEKMSSNKNSPENTNGCLSETFKVKPINGKTNTGYGTRNPDYLKYLELKQDNLIDQHPGLTEDEIVSYLYKTWMYEQSQKSDKKGNKITNYVNPNIKELQTKRKVRSRKTEEKNDISQEIEEKYRNPIKDKISPRDNIRRSASKPFYIDDDFSDVEEEIKLFEIFKNEPKDIELQTTSKVNIPTTIEIVKTENQDVEIVDDAVEEVYDLVEQYFKLLQIPKPNVFKGLLREKVCEICENISNLIKCKSCHGMFHLECCANKENDNEETTNVSNKGRKKKKPRGRKPKALNDSGSQNDSGDQDISFEECCPTYNAEKFEAKASELMIEMIKDQESQNYNYYSDEDTVSWLDSLKGKCEIVDIKLRPSKPIEISNFKCPSCEMNDKPVCFVCRNAVSPKAQIEHRQKCQVAHCNKYFHLECLDHWPQTQFHSGDQSKSKRVPESFEAFACPRHVCHTCVCDDPRGCKTRFSGDKLARCIRCPATYHTFTKCLPAGTQIVTGSHIICPRHHENKPGKVPYHVNTGWCFICALGGSLICCEYCPTSFHAECLNIKPPEGGYMCEECETGRLPLYGEMVWVKLGHYRWWPALILHPSEVPENVLQVKHSLGDFVVRFFGQYDHYWVNRGRVFPYQEGDTGKLSSQKSKLDAAFTLAIEHAHRAWDILKSTSSNDVEDEELIASLMPPHYVKLKVNKPVGSVCNFKVDSDEASLTQCDCNPNDEEPCGPNSCCLNRMLLTECGPACRAGERCHNRAFEKRQYPKLTPYRTPQRGWGLKTLEYIKQGQFVIEYVGELIDEKEFQRRMRRKHEIRDENYYFLTLDKERMIDAGPKGNLARFMNHCCEPNCETQKWTVLGDVRVGLFAMKDIPANSEVTFNYNLECAGIEKKQCLCGAKRCSGYIGAKPKQEETQPKKNKILKPNHAKRKYKKRKDKPETTPSTSSTPPKKRGRKPKPKELTEIEKDLLIIQNATKGMSSDSECSERSLKILKRKRDIDSSTDSRPTSRLESPVLKKMKYDSDSLICLD